MIKFNNKNYYSPQEAKDKFHLPLSTIYYWVDKQDLEILDIESLCKELPLESMELRSKIYVEEALLEEKTHNLKK